VFTSNPNPVLRAGTLLVLTRGFSNTPAKVQKYKIAVIIERPVYVEISQG
jgi:hypothetical protein